MSYNCLQDSQELLASVSGKGQSFACEKHRTNSNSRVHGEEPKEVRAVDCLLPGVTIALSMAVVSGNYVNFRWLGARWV